MGLPGYFALYDDATALAHDVILPVFMQGTVWPNLVHRQ